MEIDRGRKLVQCEECSAFATFDNAVKLGWDWFTGALPRTHHYCVKHRNSAARNRVFATRNDPATPTSMEGERDG